MRRVTLPYGEASVVVSLPDELEVEFVEPRASDAGPVPRSDEGQGGGGSGDEARLIDAALDAPVGAPRLEDRARGAGRVTIVVPDATRPARTPSSLEAILGRLARAEVPDAAITILVGGGIHAPGSADELAALVGARVARRVRVVASDADDPTAFVGVAPSRGQGSTAPSSRPISSSRRARSHLTTSRAGRAEPRHWCPAAPTAKPWRPSTA
jgi:hypothetical protein